MTKGKTLIAACAVAATCLVGLVSTADAQSGYYAYKRAEFRHAERYHAIKRAEAIHAHYYFAAKRAEYRHAQRYYARRAYKYGY